MNNKIKNIALPAVGFVAGILIMSLQGKSDDEAGKISEDKKPLYWVAPMDPNFRRDKPGKSPMGMDLVPVYEEEAVDDPGTVRISPDIENNLGVRTTLVEKSAMHSRIDTVGYIEYDQDRLIHIHPRVEGWLEVLHVKAEGEQVKEGQPLYKIYSPTLVSAQEELVIAMNRGNTQLIRSAETRLKALQVSENQIKQLQKTREVQQLITMYAPQDGIVADLSVREGMYVKPGNAIVSVGSLDQVWVIAEVFERQVAYLRNHAIVDMNLDYVPGRIWHGTVDYIYPTLDAKTRTVRVRLRFDNSDSVLKPNMYAQVSIHSDDPATVLQVPTEAIIRTGTQDRAVLALGDGKYKSVEVRIGRSGNNRTEILEGLEENDHIVVSAHFLLDSESSINSDFLRQHHSVSDVPEQIHHMYHNEHDMTNPKSNPVEMNHENERSSKGLL